MKEVQSLALAFGFLAFGFLIQEMFSSTEYVIHFRGTLLYKLGCGCVFIYLSETDFRKLIFTAILVWLVHRILEYL